MTTRGCRQLLLAACFMMLVAQPVLPGRRAWAEAGAGAKDVTAAPEPTEEEKLNAAVGSAKALAARLFYDVEITFRDYQPSAVREEQQHFGYGWSNDAARQLSLDKQTLTLDAVLVNPQEGLFVMADPDLSLDMVAGMELKVPGEADRPVELVAVCADQAALLLRAQGFSRELAQPAFAQNAFAARDQVLVADVTRFGNLRDIRVTPAGVNEYLAQAEQVRIFAPGDPVVAAQYAWSSGGWRTATRLVFDSEGRLSAIVVSPLLVSMYGHDNYFTDWPRPEEGLGVQALVSAVGHAVSEVDRYTYGVRLHFRQEEKTAASRVSGYYAESGAPESESVAYGLAVDDHHLLIPGELDRGHIERMDSIRVRLRSGEEVPGEFVGVYEEFAGILIRCPEQLQVPPQLWEAPQIPDLGLCVDVSVKHRFGAKDALVKYNRFLGREKGYKGKEFRRPQRPILPGAFVMDLGGRLYGFETNEKRFESVTAEGVGLETLLQRLRRVQPAQLRCFTFADMRDRFLTPEKYLDPGLRVKGIQERKELAWLGVEFQPVARDLARILGVDKETRDGEFGLLVSLVYDGSPAARLGIQPGDVLLKVQEKGKAGEHVLRGEVDLRRAGYVSSSGLGRGGGSEGHFVRSEWFDRRNVLTALLTTIGSGKEAVLTYSHAGEVKSADFTIETAPPDLISAEKRKDDWTGLTVKDITYEVRRILMLGPDYRAVIVYEVEPGSSAAVGQISPMEFIEEIDGQTVTDIGRFEAIIGQLVQRGSKSVTFKVKNLDESRFVKAELRQPRLPAGGPEQAPAPGILGAPAE
jgi:hypothetical protein